MPQKTYPHTAEIEVLLQNCSERVRKEGLNYLIPNWHRFANEYADSEASIYEWQNDMDGRHLIGKILAFLPPSDADHIQKELNGIDEQVRQKTFAVNECIWGEPGYTQENLNPEEHWYYFRMNEAVFQSEGHGFTRKQ